jgi:hypothetical protein
MNHFLIKQKICTMKKILIAGVVFALFTTAASAQGGHSAIERQRIKSGFETGQLTRGEKFRLEKGEANYRHEKRRAGRDGRFSHGERRRLHYMRRHQSRKTFYMKHNHQRRKF